jgi:phytoene dehydrogenase-like protein
MNAPPVVVVVGAGIGGLTAAAYLAQAGCDVLLLEAADRAGGCAGRFSVGDYHFHAGATTLVGLEPDMPLGIVFRELGLAFHPPASHGNLAVHHGSRHFVVSGDTATNVATLRGFYGSGCAAFWREAMTVAQRSWHFLVATSLPPRTSGDILQAFRSGGLALLSQALPSARRVLGGYGDLSPSTLLLLDELLLISTQATSGETPYLFAALGLQYLERPFFFPKNGMGAIVDALLTILDEAGSTVGCNAPVVGVKRSGRRWRVSTAAGDFSADAVVLNLTHWDAARITEGRERAFFVRQARLHSSAWGSCGIYCGVPDVFPAETPLYHQIVLDATLPQSRARSLFVTLSRPGDEGSAPPGHRAITVSCHTPVEHWQGMTGTAYEAAKARVRGELFTELTNHLVPLRGVRPEPLLVATPGTWEARTGRSGGRVGGLPFRYRVLLGGYPSGRTPFPRLLRVGDTIFPGQSVVAVAWGARRVARELLDTLLPGGSREPAHSP